jgi:hypothetical protein
MLDFWADELPAGEQRVMRIIAINDLDKNWRGQVRLRLLRGKHILAEQIQSCGVPAFGQQELSFQFTSPAEPGNYTLEAALVQSGQPDVRSLRDFAVLTAEQREARRNLARGRPVVATWLPPGKTGTNAPRPELVVDGDRATRLTIPFGQWLAIDLGAVHTVSRAEIAATFLWNRTPTSYVIQVSGDGKSWQEAFATNAGTKTVVTARFKPVSARWVRVMFRQVEKAKTYSISEVSIFH